MGLLNVGSTLPIFNTFTYLCQAARVYDLPDFPIVRLLLRTIFYGKLKTVK